MFEQAASLASPALHRRGENYPFGDAVPRAVRMRRTCFPAFAAADLENILPIAFIGQTYECYVGEDGDLAVFLPSGQILHLESGSYDVVTFHGTQKH